MYENHCWFVIVCRLELLIDLPSSDLFDYFMLWYRWFSMLFYKNIEIMDNNSIVC